MMKKSSSKLSTSKGSVNHIGTTPYRFRIDIFVSYAENIKNLTEACITCERRGKIYATESVNVKDGKAVFRQVLSMECTLFRKNSPSKGKQEKTQSGLTEQLDFDEKKAKMFLRKGGSQGKAVAKLALNLSEYVKGASSTVFADMKLSDGTLVVTKVESTMLAMDKKKKGSRNGSEIVSEMSDAQSVDDSLLGDDDDLQHAQCMMDVVSEPQRTSSIDAPGIRLSSIGVSTMPSSVSPVTPCRLSRRMSENADDVSKGSIDTASSLPLHLKQKNPTRRSGSVLNTDELTIPKSSESSSVKEGSSLKEKMKSKIKSRHLRKDKEDKNGITSSHNNPHNDSPSSDGGGDIAVESSVKSTEIIELMSMMEALQKENTKLKRARNSALEEAEALRTELKTCELRLGERDRDGNNAKSAVETKIALMRAETKKKDKEIKELKTRNGQLMDELEEQHQEILAIAKQLKEKEKEKEREKGNVGKNDEQKDGRQTKLCDSAMSEGGRFRDATLVENEVITLKNRIGELELALQREPTFMDVVNELKVIKVTLALANMEKEQALFQLQTYRMTSHQIPQSETMITPLLSDDT